MRIFAAFDDHGRLTGFYSPDVHGDRIPAGAVEITEEYRDSLLADEAKGKRIIADEAGYPVAVDPPPLPLDQIKERKRQEIASACRSAIESGIVCAALGSAHTYPTTLTDQHNLAGTVMAAMNAGDKGGLYKFWCADSQGLWARREHTAEQIIAVGEAVRAHVTAQQDRYEQRLAEIDQATAETISTITW
jgi:hypothetical protein